LPVSPGESVIHQIVRRAQVLLSTLSVAALLLSAGGAAAAPSTEKCLALKRQAWAELRKCQAAKELRLLDGKTADLEKCEMRFDGRLAKLSENAAEAEIECRYGDNGDGTVTDYDTGLQWEKKTGTPGGACALGDPHCVNDQYEWEEVQAFVSTSAFAAPTLITTCYFGHCDWRLPTVVELQAIADASAAGCGGGPACISPVFGPTHANLYWSATTYANAPDLSWQVNFNVPQPVPNPRENDAYFRAVRRAF
jgi:hypothetical protein